MADLDRVRVWGEALIRMHLDASQWTFGFDRAKRRAGLCNFSRHHISISRYVCESHSDDEIYQVLLHEIAHAIAGPAAGHGPQWRETARELGYTGGRLHPTEIAASAAQWIGVCPAGHEAVRFRTPTRDVSCGRCSRSFSPQHLLVWQRRRTAEAAPKHR